MPKLKRYAFIVKHQSYGKEKQNALLESKDFETKIVGVSSCEEAVEVINDLVENKVQLVELCGGFSNEEKAVIKEKTKGVVAIGFAELDDENNDLLLASLE